MSEETVEFRGQSIGDVNAHAVHMSQSTARELEADRVELHQSAVQLIDADSIELRQSAAQMIDADTLRMQQSLTLGARTETLQAEQSVLGMVRTHEATLADSSVLALAGDHIQAANVNTVFLIGRNIEGDIKTMMDTRGALMFGLAAGGVLGFFSLISALARRFRR
ncbi:MAG TPA: hypothetical protein VFF70_09430 [Anaerolineae bacterium]|jgi:hypothetical protein|nr:hypothetical protein [Anaerolineae bacterium]